MNIIIPGKKYNFEIEEFEINESDEQYEDFIEEEIEGFQINKDELFEHDIDRVLIGETDQDILRSTFREDQEWD